MFQRFAPHVGPNQSVRLADPSSQNMDQRVYNLPTGDQIAAICIEGNEPFDLTHRDFLIRHPNRSLRRISKSKKLYDPLHYVLLNPHGELGWFKELKDQLGKTIIF